MDDGTANYECTRCGHDIWIKFPVFAVDKAIEGIQKNDYTLKSQQKQYHVWPSKNIVHMLCHFMD